MMEFNLIIIDSDGGIVHGHWFEPYDFGHVRSTWHNHRCRFNIGTMDSGVQLLDDAIHWFVRRFAHPIRYVERNSPRQSE